jgi:hypothetical protein
VRAADPSPDEERFFRELSDRVPELEDYYYEDADGTPWMCVALSCGCNACSGETRHLDWDGHSLRGGWLPAPQNLDDWELNGLGADHTGIEARGLKADNITCAEAVELAAAWLLVHKVAAERSALRDAALKRRAKSPGAAACRPAHGDNASPHPWLGTHWPSE